VIRVLLYGFLLYAAACTPRQPRSSLLELQNPETWNQARELYFHSTKAPVRPYDFEGEKAEIIDVRVYQGPQPDLVIVTYGETYHDTTGWDVHVALMRTNDIPTYPGNVYICPNGFDFAIDWIDTNTMGVYYPAGYYPDKRDYTSGRSTRSPTFQYEKKVGAINVKFIAADKSTMEIRKEAMDAKQLRIGEGRTR
jgi:hypothetical protein